MAVSEEMGVLSRPGAQDCMDSRVLCWCIHGQAGTLESASIPPWGLEQTLPNMALPALPSKALC